MSYLDWKVGDRVICVDDDFDVGHHPVYRTASLPTKGGVYTVRGFYESTLKGVAVLLDEIVNPPMPSVTLGWRELGFKPKRFRKVQPRKTDISIFTAMLHDQRQKVPV